jgi:hypothetical protein
MHCFHVRLLVRRGGLCFGWWEPSVNVSARVELVRRVISNAANADGLLAEVPAAPEPGASCGVRHQRRLRSLNCFIRGTVESNLIKRMIGPSLVRKYVCNSQQLCGQTNGIFTRRKSPPRPESMPAPIARGICPRWTRDLGCLLCHSYGMAEWKNGDRGVSKGLGTTEVLNFIKRVTRHDPILVHCVPTRWHHPNMSTRPPNHSRTGVLSSPGNKRSPTRMPEA